VFFYQDIRYRAEKKGKGEKEQKKGVPRKRGSGGTFRVKKRLQKGGSWRNFCTRHWGNTNHLTHVRLHHCNFVDGKERGGKEALRKKLGLSSIRSKVKYLLKDHQGGQGGVRRAEERQ